DGTAGGNRSGQGSPVVRTGVFGGAGSESVRKGPAVVADAGFGAAPAEPGRARRGGAEPGGAPVEILWKPKPQYTDEGRAKKLEGEVVLEVVFRASGEVQVVRVVRGLGSGLDEAARAAAEQIRFRPSRRGGVAVDSNGRVQIT